MTINELIQRLTKLVTHGVSPNAQITLYDPEIEGYAPLGGFIYSESSVMLEPLDE